MQFSGIYANFFLVFELRKPRWDQLKGTEDAEGYGELGTASAQRARNSSLGSMSGQRLAWLLEHFWVFFSSVLSFVFFETPRLRSQKTFLKIIYMPWYVVLSKNIWSRYYLCLRRITLWLKEFCLLELPPSPNEFCGRGNSLCGRLEIHI